MSLQLLWYLGWLLAIAMLVSLGLRVAVAPKFATIHRQLKLVVFIGATVVMCAIGQRAIVQHDYYFDLSKEHVFSADPTAEQLIDSLTEPVTVTYFGHDDDPNVKRLKIVLAAMDRRSRWFTAVTADPDKNPLLARRYGVKFYNIAVIESAHKRVIANTTSEIDISIAIQKALRIDERRICFTIGHGEYEINNQEFHTHMESFGNGDSHSDHQHGHAHIPIVQTIPHGIGRLRGALEGLGYLVDAINLTTDDLQVRGCDALAIVAPKHPFSPQEVEKLQHYSRSNRTLLALLDVGYSPGPLAAFLRQGGIELTNTVVIDNKQHHANDNESLAISSYPGHPITNKIAMTIFPAARALTVNADVGGASRASALVTASPSSKVISLDEHQSHTHPSGSPNEEEKLTNQAKALPPIVIAISDSDNGRLLVSGDADFVSNSYFPYLSNSALALSIFRWAVGEGEAIKTEPPLAVFESLILTQAQMRVIFIALVLLLPITFLVIGLTVWLVRR